MKYVLPIVEGYGVHGQIEFDSMEALNAHLAAQRATSERDAELVTAVQKLQDSCHSASRRAGWWANSALDAVNTREPFGLALVGQKLCLIHSEVSEAMEGHRKDLMDDKLPHRPMIEVELADAVIRIADLAGAMCLDLGGAIAEKLAFNAQRPDHKAEVRAAAGGKAY